MWKKSRSQEDTLQMYQYARAISRKLFPNQACLCLTVQKGYRLVPVTLDRFPPKTQPRPGPSLAQARFLGIWKSGNLVSPQKEVKIKIRVGQNVGNVWISTKKKLMPPCVSDLPWWSNGCYSFGKCEFRAAVWALSAVDAADGW